MFKDYTKAIFILLTFVLSSASGLEERYLAPPRLDASAIGRKIICYRPMRELAPNFSLEGQGNKIIIHNYGHGGAGWSLGMGSVKYCCELLREHTPALDKSTPIAIVGAGCIGLFTAYNLWNEGFENITIYAKAFDDLTSHHAGGLLSFRAIYTEKSTNELILTMGENTYQFFRSIALGDHPDFSKGASLIPTYFQNLEDSELEDLVGRGMSPAKNVLVNFGNGVQRNMIVYDDSLFIDTGEMMSQLSAYLSSKIKWKQQEIKNFQNLPENIVFNCTGLGSQELNQDLSVYPVQGHLIMLKSQEPKELRYMLIANFDEVKDDGKEVYRTLDFFPKKIPNSGPNDVGVLGGTFIKGNNVLASNLEEFDLMIERARQFFYQNTLSLTKE